MLELRPDWRTVRRHRNLHRSASVAGAARDGECPDCGRTVPAGDVIVLRGQALDHGRVDLSGAEWACPDCAPHMRPPRRSADA